jgi:hypothetical protein
MSKGVDWFGPTGWLLSLVLAVPAIAILVWLGLVRNEMKLEKATRKKME